MFHGADPTGAQALGHRLLRLSGVVRDTTDRLVLAEALAEYPTGSVGALDDVSQQLRSTAAAVVHLHSCHSVALSMMPDVDEDNFLPPLTPYGIMRLGKVKLLPFFLPGDPAMGEAVRGLAGKRSAVMLANHGPVVAGKDVEAACNAVEELEENAKLAMLMRGIPARGLTDAQVSDLVTTFDVEWDD